MKSIITSVFSNQTYSKDTARGIETIYMKELLDENGHETFILGKRGSRNKHLDFYLDINDVDINDYDNIFIQLTAPNFFGGILSDYVKLTIEKLALASDKNFIIIPTDPRIKPVNPAEVIATRFDTHSEFIEGWYNIIKNATYLFTGKDIKKFWDLDTTPSDVKMFDLFTYIFSKNSTISDMDCSNKEYDTIYYGDKRGSYREKKIRNFFTMATNNLLVAYKTDRVPADFVKKVKHYKLQNQINRAKVSLIIADKEHEDNVVTFRLFEALASNALAAIDLSFDPNREIIKDEVLRDILYIENAADIKRLADSYSIDLIRRQHAELSRMFDEVDSDINKVLGIKGVKNESKQTSIKNNMLF